MKHDHHLNAGDLYADGVLTQFTVGCKTCGPQWLITLDHELNTLSIEWVHAPWRIQYEREGARLTASEEAPRG